MNPEWCNKAPCRNLKIIQVSLQVAVIHHHYPTILNNCVNATVSILCRIYTIQPLYGMYLNNMTVGPKTHLSFLLPEFSKIDFKSDHQN